MGDCVLSYFVGVMLYVTVRDYATLIRLLCALALALLVAYTTYLLFPVYFERLQLKETSLHTWLLSITYKDMPYNHFPSLHVTLSWLAVHASQVLSTIAGIRPLPGRALADVMYEGDRK